MAIVYSRSTYEKSQGYDRTPGMDRAEKSLTPNLGVSSLMVVNGRGASYVGPVAGMRANMSYPIKFTKNRARRTRHGLRVTVARNKTSRRRRHSRKHMTMMMNRRRRTSRNPRYFLATNSRRRTSRNRRRRTSRNSRRRRVSRNEYFKYNGRRTSRRRTSRNRRRRTSRR